MHDISAFMAFGKRFTVDFRVGKKTFGPNHVQLDCESIDLSSDEFRHAVTRVSELLLAHDDARVNLYGKLLKDRIAMVEYDIEVLYALSEVIVAVNNLE